MMKKLISSEKKWKITLQEEFEWFFSIYKKSMKTILFCFFEIILNTRQDKNEIIRWCILSALVANIIQFLRSSSVPAGFYYKVDHDLIRYGYFWLGPLICIMMYHYSNQHKCIIIKKKRSRCEIVRSFVL